MNEDEIQEVKLEIQEVKLEQCKYEAIGEGITFSNEESKSKRAYKTREKLTPEEKAAKRIQELKTNSINEKLAQDIQIEISKLDFFDALELLTIALPPTSRKHESVIKLKKRLETILDKVEEEILNGIINLVGSGYINEKNYALAHQIIVSMAEYKSPYNIKYKYNDKLRNKFTGNKRDVKLILPYLFNKNETKEN